MAGVPTNVAQLMAVLGLNTLPFEAQAAKASAMMAPGGLLFMGMAGLGVIAAGTGIIATKMAGDFQQGMATIVTGAGEAASAIPALSAGVLQLAKDTGTSTKQLTDGLYMIESGGFRLNTPIKALDLLRAAAEGAKVGNADLGVVADATDTILKNFGENGALTANQAVNTLIDTVAHGKTHMEDLASALAMVLPTGAAAGLGLNDVMGAMATMTSIGVPAAESATYLRQTIVALMAPSAGAKNALAEIGLTAKQVADSMSEKNGGSLPMALQLITDHLTKKFPVGSAGYLAAIREISGGSRQMQGMLDLTGNHLQTFYDNWYRLGVTMTGTTDKVTGWELVQKNLNQQFDRAKEALATMMINLGQKLLPVATAFFQFLADKGLPAIQQLAGWLGDRLGEASKTIAQTWHDLTSKGGALYAVIQMMPNILAGVHYYFDLLGRVWREQIQPGLVQMLPALKIIGIILAVVIVAAIALSITAFLLLVGVITAVILILVKIGQFFGWMAQQFGIAVQLVKTNIGIFLGHMGELGENLNKKIHDIIDGVLTFFSTLPAKMQVLGENIIKGIAQGMQNARSAVVNAVKNIPIIGGIAGGINNFLPKFAAQGGTFGEGEWGVVGERGPETISMHGGRATITPLHGAGIAASPGGRFGGAGQFVITPQTVNISIDGRKVATAVVTHSGSAVRAVTGKRSF